VGIDLYKTVSCGKLSNDNSITNLSHSVIGALDEDLLWPPIIFRHRVHEPFTTSAVGVKQLRGNLDPLQHRRLNTPADT